MSRPQVHVPISPTPSFFTMIQCLAESLRRFGGTLSDARLVVSVGEDCEPFDIPAARPELAPYDIVWRWVDRQAFREHSYFATGMDRWAEPFESDIVIMADADILILGGLGDLAPLMEGDTVAGVIATYPPFLARGGGDDDAHWMELFRLAGLPPPSFDYPIPGHGIFYDRAEASRSPPYYNFGFLMGTGSAMNKIRETFAKDYLVAAGYMKTDLAAQAGLCLSIVRHAIRAVWLPVRYNFWTHHYYLRSFPREAANVCVLHYLVGPLAKHRDNDSLDDVRRWVSAHAGSAEPLEAFVAGAFARVVAPEPPRPEVVRP